MKNQRLALKYAKRRIQSILSLGLALFSLAAPLLTAKAANLDDARATLVQVIKYSNEGKLAGKPALAMLSGVAKSWQIPSLGALQPQPDKIVATDDNHAVGRTQWRGKDGQTTDYYFYLVRAKDGRWTVEDCRSLASIGMVWEARKKLRAHKKPSAEQTYQLNNMDLILSSDAQLKAWFDKNRAKLDALRLAAKALPKPHESAIKASDKKYPAIAKSIELLGLDGISIHDSGEMQAVIGGVDRDIVGLLYSDGGKTPSISPRSWLWIEDLGGHWYLFRHT